MPTVKGRACTILGEFERAETELGTPYVCSNADTAVVECATCTRCKIKMQDVLAGKMSPPKN
jgi:hypothetical protein